MRRYLIGPALGLIALLLLFPFLAGLLPIVHFVRERIDIAVYQIASGAKPGLTVLGLKEGGVDYSIDEFNAKLITPDMKKKVDAAKADIVSGKIKVADYMADNACKY